ncbi:hypothetical protein [Caldicellulosiruptor naganoensis]|uniref:Uncharacterized protein n=1 Tax=Caldicellulosiruptor naganoensis TaxID=29324 RepID=A0ABY7BDF0_9FIRM|nr:hypothetical protein [Caldicellulosiruptor naganoensis]WAM30859.1 hypothetical protein OTJ99_001648 [Caldicellulosiruptor naganoensis]
MDLYVYPSLSPFFVCFMYPKRTKATSTGEVISINLLVARLLNLINIG